MQRIYKFSLDVDQNQVIMLPAVHRILHIGQQDGVLMMWVLLYPEHKFDTKKIFHVYATGFDDIPTNVNYLQTVQVGPFVWHIFIENSEG